MSTRAKKKGLGRGLSSLIATPPEPVVAAADTPYLLCPIEAVVPMRGQPRKHFDDDRLDELAASIEANGIIQPLVVRAAEDGDTYRLIAGERRWRAAQRAGLSEVPVVIKELAEDVAFEVALVENIQREDLNAIEEAEAYRRLIDEHGYTQEAIAERVGRSRSAVANALRLLKLEPAVQELVADNEISAGHARAVLSVPTEAQAGLAERILTEGLTVRQAEDMGRRIKEPQPEPDEPKTRPKRPPKTDGTGRTPLRPQLRHVQRRLMEALGARVEIVERPDGSGHLAVHFADPSGLQNVVDEILRDRE